MSLYLKMTRIRNCNSITFISTSTKNIELKKLGIKLTSYIAELKKGPNLSWISYDVDIIFLVETWEHEESKVPNIDGFTLWSTLNKRSSCRGIGGIACYIKNNISPHARVYKNDPYNQYSWIEFTDIYDKKILHSNLLFHPHQF